MIGMKDPLPARKAGRLIQKLTAALLSLCLTVLLSGCVDMSNRDPVLTFVLDDTRSSGIGGTFVMELFPEKAPNSVNYFLSLAVNGYYDDFNVSKVFAGSMVVFGDPWFAKKNDRVIAGEFAENGFAGNDVEFVRGTVGLSRDEDDPDSSFGDFFIVLSDDAGKDLNGKYCAIGKITSGLEVIDEISLLKTTSSLGYQPYVSVATLRVTVDLRGRTYPEPVTSDRKNKPGYWYE